MSKNKFLLLISAVVFAILGTGFLLFTITPKTLVNVKAASFLNLVVLGDSITNQGVVTTNGWVNQYKTQLVADLQENLQIINLATNGITSSQLLNSVSNDPNYRSQIATSQILTLEIGYNDFFQARGSYQNGTCGGTDNQDCLRTMVSTFDANWDNLMTQIRQLTANQAGSTVYRDFDIYYSVATVDQSNGTFSVLNSYLSQMNNHLTESSSQNGFQTASVHTAYNGTSGLEDPIAKGYILPDAVHPTDLGHTIIADRMVGLGYSPLLIDTDGDGCPDVKEVGNNWELGGARDPNNRWDFFDVPVPAINSTNWNLPIGDPKRPKLDHVISVNDSQAVWSYQGTTKGGKSNPGGYNYNTNYGYQMGLTNDPNFTDGMFYDRSLAADQTRFWQTGAPLGGINAQTAQLEFSLFKNGGSNCR